MADVDNVVAQGESILTSIKKLLGIADEYTQFDVDIILHINSVFSILSQLGVGPEQGFAIQDKSALWSDFLPASPTLNDVRTFVYLKVKLIFDPPTGSAVLTCYKELLAELEFRINVEAESLKQSS